MLLCVYLLKYEAKNDKHNYQVVIFDTKFCLGAKAATSHTSANQSWRTRGELCRVGGLGLCMNKRYQHCTCACVYVCFSRSEDA